MARSSTILPETSQVAQTWSKQDLSYHLRCHDSFVDALTRDKKLPPPIKLGKSKRWRRCEIEAWQMLGMPYCGHLYAVDAGGAA